MNAFDGFFGIYTAFGDEPPPRNRSVASVLISRTCADGYTANAGYITYEGIHPHCDDLAYTPIDKRTLWDDPSISITTIRQGKNRLEGHFGGAKLDSMEQDIVLPKEVLDKLELNATYTEHGFIVDCDSRPEITFSFNSTGEFVVTARELMYKASDGKCYLQVRPHVPSPTDVHKSTNETFVLGLPFLRQFCIAFDLENSRIGIGSRKAEASKEICHYQTPLPSRPQRQCAAMKRQIPSPAATQNPLVLLVLALFAAVISLSP